MASQRSCGAFLLAGPSKACFRKGLTAKKHFVPQGHAILCFAGPLRAERDSGGPPAAGISPFLPIRPALSTILPVPSTVLLPPPPAEMSPSLAHLRNISPKNAEMSPFLDHYRIVVTRKAEGLLMYDSYPSPKNGHVQFMTLFFLHQAYGAAVNGDRICHVRSVAWGCP